MAKLQAHKTEIHIEDKDGKVQLLVDYKNGGSVEKFDWDFYAKEEGREVVRFQVYHESVFKSFYPFIEGRELHQVGEYLTVVDESFKIRLRSLKVFHKTSTIITQGTWTGYDTTHHLGFPDENNEFTALVIMRYHVAVHVP